MEGKLCLKSVLITADAAVLDPARTSGFGSLSPSWSSACCATTASAVLAEAAADKHMNGEAEDALSSASPHK